MEQLQEFAKEIVDRYIKSMGYNPETIDRNKRMAFTKTRAFQNFAARMHEEVELDEPVRGQSRGKITKTKTGTYVATNQSGNTKSFNSEHEAKKHSETGELDEAKDSYTIYHPTYSAAVQHAHEHLKKKGLEISDDDWFRHVNSGPKKPGEGQTNRLDIPLHKDGKETKKHAHIQVHNRGNDVKNAYELNMYHEALEFGQGDFDPKGTSAKVVGEKKLSKKASVVKELYMKHREVREGLYDHEKDDKDAGNYGKKPKLATPDGDQTGDKKSQAAAVMSGGTTLTGQKRDTVEIDPILQRAKPGVSNADMGQQK